MYETEIKIGLIGFDDNLAEQFQEQSEEFSGAVSFRVIKNFSEMSIKGLHGIAQVSDDLNSVYEVIMCKPDLTSYLLCSSVYEKIPEDLLESVDILTDSSMTESMMKFYMRRFIRMVTVTQKNKLRKACLDTMMNMLPDLVWFKDNKGKYIRVNDSFCRMAQKDVIDIRGRDSHEIWGEGSRVDNFEKNILEPEREIVNMGSSAMSRVSLRGTSGMMRKFKVYRAPIYDSFGNLSGIVGVAHDTTRTEKYRDNMLTMVRHDYLTGLANRRHLYSLIRKNWREGKLTVMFCDLDGFKAVNDNFGHAAGDEALITVSNVLRDVLDETMVARVGGDEFLVAYIGNYRTKDMQDKCDAIEYHLQQRFSGDERFAGLSISIGIASSIFGIKTLDELLTCGDRAMYEAKKTKNQKGRKCYYVYNNKKND